MHRWNEFPGLEAAVKQVDSIVWSDLKGKGIPGGRVEFDLPKFDNGTSLSKAKAKKPKSVATDIVDKSKSTQTQSPNKPMLSMETQSSNRHPRPEFAAPNDQQQHLHQYVYSTQSVLGGDPRIPNLHWTPQLQRSYPAHPPYPWQEPVQSYYHPHFLSYHVMPYYQVDKCEHGPGRSDHGQPEPRVSNTPDQPQPHAFPQPLAAGNHHGFAPVVFLPPPAFQPPGPPAPNSRAPKKSPVTLTTLSTSELGPVIVKQPDNQQLCKRESPDSLEPSISDHQRCKRESSDSVQPLESGHPRLLKRRRSVGAETVSEADDPQSSKRRPLRLPNGLPDSDFGTWFENKVTRNKKKLSRIRSDLGASGSPR